MALVANAPNHAWYQRQNHNRIPRLAESRDYLDDAYAKSVPPAVDTRTHALLVGTEPAYRGYMNVSGIFIGAVEPLTWRGKTIVQLAQNSGTNTLHIDLGSVQVSPGVTTISASFLGGPGPITVTWNAGAFRYIASGQSALTTFLNARVGQNVGVTLS